MATSNPQDNYEQLKRKNRRRLVGAVVMVLAAAALLLTVLNRKDAAQPEAQQVVLSGLDTTASAEAEAPVMASGSADDGADLAPGTVLEPQPLPEESVASAPAAVAVTPLTPAPAVKPPASTTGLPEETKPAQKATPVQSKPAPKPAAPAQAKPEPKVSTKPAAKAVPKPDSKATAKLSPQDILNNKAAAQVKPAPGSKPAAPGGGKALIQVGAYTSEQQAKAVQQKLAAAGISAGISQSQTSKGVLYRVRTGTFASRAQAEQNLSRIRAQGLDGMVIGQ